MQSLLVVANATEVLAIAGCVFGYQFVDAARCAVWNGCGVRSSCDYGGSNADEVYRIVLHLGKAGVFDAVRGRVPNRFNERLSIGITTRVLCTTSSW